MNYFIIPEGNYDISNLLKKMNKLGVGDKLEIS
jgi:hypothetical protein